MISLPEIFFVKLLESLTGQDARARRRSDGFQKYLKTQHRQAGVCCDRPHFKIQLPDPALIWYTNCTVDLLTDYFPEQ